MLPWPRPSSARWKSPPLPPPAQGPWHRRSSGLRARSGHRGRRLATSTTRQSTAYVVQVLLGRDRGPVRPVCVAGRFRQRLRVHGLLVKSKKRLHNMLLQKAMRVASGTHPELPGPEPRHAMHLGPRAPQGWRVGLLGGGWERRRPEVGGGLLPWVHTCPGPGADTQRAHAEGWGAGRGCLVLDATQEKEEGAGSTEGPRGSDWQGERGPGPHQPALRRNFPLTSRYRTLRTGAGSEGRVRWALPPHHSVTGDFNAKASRPGVTHPPTHPRGYVFTQRTGGGTFYGSDAGLRGLGETTRPEPGRRELLSRGGGGAAADTHPQSPGIFF